MDGMNGGSHWFCFNPDFVFWLLKSEEKYSAMSRISSITLPRILLSMFCTVIRFLDEKCRSPDHYKKYYFP